MAIMFPMKYTPPKYTIEQRKQIKEAAKIASDSVMSGNLQLFITLKKLVDSQKAHNAPVTGLPHEPHKT